MAHEFVCWRTRSCGSVGIDPGGDAKNDRTRCNRACGKNEAAEVRPNRQGQDDMGDHVAGVVEVAAKPASDVQLGGQNAVQIVHHVVVKDQRNQKSVAVVKEENYQGQYAQDRRRVGQVPVNEVALRVCHR